MKKSTRRTFISTAATVTVAVAAAPLLAHAHTIAKMTHTAKRPPVVHHVFFWLKNPSSIEDRNKLVEGVKTLAHIKLVKELHVGILAPTEKRDVVDASWQVSELMFFDNVADQAGYQNDPIHLDFVKNYSHLWEKVVVYDMTEV